MEAKIKMISGSTIIIENIYDIYSNKESLIEYIYKNINGFIIIQNTLLTVRHIESIQFFENDKL